MASTSIDAVVVLYHPDDTVGANILSYADRVKTLYIVDNTETPHDFFQTFSYPNILLHSGSNIGISEAYNLALKQAEQNGTEWLLTMDQDTAFVGKDELDSFIEKLGDVDPSAAICTPVHNSRFKRTPGIWESQDVVMSSANFVRVQAAQAVDGYDERLFIDEVDHSFCLRLRLQGYGLMQHTGFAVSHRLGINDRASFVNRKRYPALRLYYMLRNYLLLREMYRDNFPEFFKTRDRYLLCFMFGQLLDTDVGSKLGMLWRGWRDFRKRRFGKMQDD